MQTQNNSSEPRKEEKPNYVLHDGKRFEIAELEKGIDPSNEGLQRAYDEQVKGNTETAQQRAEREAQSAQERSEKDPDVLVVTDSARTRVQAHNADRDRSVEALTPQPGPVVQAVNGKVISAAVPELNTLPAQDFIDGQPLKDAQAPLGDGKQNEAERLGETGDGQKNDQKSSDDKKSGGSDKKSDK